TWARTPTPRPVPASATPPPPPASCRHPGPRPTGDPSSPRPVAPRATALRGNLEPLELLAMPRERTPPQATPGRPPRARLRTANTERAVPRPTRRTAPYRAVPRRTAPYRAGHDPERT